MARNLHWNSVDFTLAACSFYDLVCSSWIKINASCFDFTSRFICCSLIYYVFWSNKCAHRLGKGESQRNVLKMETCLTTCIWNTLDLLYLLIFLFKFIFFRFWYFDFYQLFFKASFWFFGQFAFLIANAISPKFGNEYILPNLIMEIDTSFTSGAVTGAVFSVALPVVREAVNDANYCLTVWLF